MPPPPDHTEVERFALWQGRSIEGYVEDGYGPVVETFIENFQSRGDTGAGCAIYVDGKLVVDVWGGVADSRTGRPWDHDTSAVIFSCSKGILAICVYLLAQEGRIDMDAPVADYWPGFAQHGKEGITVRQAMSHRAGLPCLEADLTLEQVLGWEAVVAEIEKQSPLYPHGAGHVYHAMTFGWVVGELIRRITGMMPGRFFRTAVGDALGLRTWIGLPAAEQASVAWMDPPLPDEDSDLARETARLVANDPMIERSLTMGGAFAFPARDGLVTFNAPEIQAAEIPGANGISSAPSLARLYAGCVSTLSSPPLLTPESIEDALRVQSRGTQLNGVPDDGARWGTGFQISSPPTQPMLGAASFGHAGAGGQLAFADAEHRVGFAYLSNQMGGYGDARARELTSALARCLKSRR
ncbi:MAG: beta-lactamase family protein [Acidimicrobiia bacterium]|nr:beta-lactamase family protein [Acidimicrobiia bacterium]